MRARYTLLPLIALVAATCGGTPAAVTPSPTQQPTVALQTATPQSTPTLTIAPTTTPRPTPKLPVLVEVTSDADIDEFFVGLPAEEVTTLVKGMAKENFKVVLPFDPHGLKFQLKVFRFTHPEGGVYTVFTVTLTEGTATIKRYLPTLMTVDKYFAPDRTPLYTTISPTDETTGEPGPGGFLYYKAGGRGVYVYLPYTAETLVPLIHTLEEKDVRMGSPMAKVTAAMTPLTWPASGHIVIIGYLGPKSTANASPITPDSLLKRDGKIAYIK